MSRAHMLFLATVTLIKQSHKVTCDRFRGPLALSSAAGGVGDSVILKGQGKGFLIIGRGQIRELISGKGELHYGQIDNVMC